MNTLKLSTLIIFLLVYSSPWLQTPNYELDPHWTLQWEDNFNNMSTTQNNWHFSDNFDHWGNNWVTRAANVTMPAGQDYLVLHFKQESYTCPPEALNTDGCYTQFNSVNSSVPYSYTTGYIESYAPVGYGYIESRLKFDSFNTFKANIAFWLFEGSPNYNEVDIIEALPNRVEWLDNSGYPNGNVNSGGYPAYTAHDENIISSNIHYAPPNTVNASNYFLIELDDYTDWHTYGLEYTSKKMIWYIDGIKVREEENHNIDQAMKVIFNIGGSGSINESIAPNRSRKMFIDYFRYYKLKSDCYFINAGVFDFANHDNEIKNSITIGNGNAFNTVSVGSEVYLRAEDFIQINGTLTIPLGAEFNLYPNDCNSVATKTE